MSQTLLSRESDIFGWLIHPLAADEFERSFYEQRVCVVQREDPDYYRELLSLEDLDRVLGTHSPQHPAVNVVQDGQHFPVSELTDNHGRVDPLRAAKLFADGATLIFGHLHTQLPALAHLCTALSQIFSARMQTNIYLSPSTAQGFAPHFDTHDVFVLQVAGSKQWKIYDTKIALPVRGQQFDPKQHQPGEVTQEFELQAGDMVYVPRGAMHAARSSAEWSLHITTGLLGFTWADLLVEGVGAAALADESFRKNLPLGFARPDFPAEEKTRLLREKLARVSAYIETGFPHAAYFSGELLSEQKPCLVNLLRQVSQLKRLSLASQLRPRLGIAWDLREDESGCVLRCLGNEITLPSFAAEALRFALRTPGFAVAEIPDSLDAEGKLTLARRLVREGILECPEFGL